MILKSSSCFEKKIVVFFSVRNGLLIILLINKYVVLVLF